MSDHLQLKLGYRFLDGNLLMRALTHKSYRHENEGESQGDNEKLEFLGDAVLDLVVSDLLMKKFPQLTEGDLSKIRASLVNEKVLAEIALEFELDKEIYLGRGEILTGGALKPRILASAVEAVIGAFYLDAGFLPTFSWIEKIFSFRLTHLDLNLHFATDYKTRLQEFYQDRYRATPVYIVVNEEGPDHEKKFQVEVRQGDHLLGCGQGRSKKMAEQEAAREALMKVDENEKNLIK